MKTYKLQNTLLTFCGFFAIWLFCSAQMCTKKIAYAREFQTGIVSKNYLADVPTTYENTKKSLKKMGYQILHENKSSGTITTGWRSVESSSHYFDLFGRPDYSAALGSYYQMIAIVSQSGNQVRVALMTNVKSVAGKLLSSKRAENKVLNQLDTYMRRPQIEITNVGMEER